MKLLSELYADTISLWSKHHSEIIDHLAQIVEAATAANSPLTGTAITIGEDVVSAILSRLAALEAKVNPPTP